MVTSIEPARVPTSGADYIWLRGHNFGHLPDVELYCRSVASVTEKLGLKRSALRGRRRGREEEGGDKKEKEDGGQTGRRCVGYKGLKGGREGSFNKKALLCGMSVMSVTKL